MIFQIILMNQEINLRGLNKTIDGIELIALKKIADFQVLKEIVDLKIQTINLIHLHNRKETKNKCIESKKKKGPNGETHCWWQCTVKGGREGRDIGAYELAVAMEDLGAGEILLNCIDEDGQGNGFDHELVGLVSDAVGIPVIASSGAGKPSHFTDVFEATNCSAALAAGIFHREEVAISEVKEHMKKENVPTRL